MKRIWIKCAVLILISRTSSSAAADQRPPFPIPASTISAGAQASLASFQEAMRGFSLGKVPLPGPDDVKGWRTLQDNYLKMAATMGAKAMVGQEYTHESRSISNVPVVDVKPAHWKNSKDVLVYIHGGGYVFGSADANLATAVITANATGMRTVSVDYTVAPAGKWQTATDEVIKVIRGLQQEGHPVTRIAVMGDSAGGGLAAGALLKLRDKKMPMPGAVVLWSPWSDITENGDTYGTLKAVDTLQYKDNLDACAAAYAKPADQKNPYVSPVYGDYSKGFPPTLIQGGTREIFLSNFIRLYQAIDSAGQVAKLDLYEGMPHVFQLLLVGTPESALALRKTADFLHHYIPPSD